jgi:acetyl-CoA C-acetyltransferase
VNRVYIVAARRTPIRPKNGDLRTAPFYGLAACAIRAVLGDLQKSFQRDAQPHPFPDPPRIHSLIAGNALGAGGNPARLMSLAAGLPPDTPDLSIDSQCCSGLDAIGLAFERIKGRRGSESAPVIAGGSESASLAPLRRDRHSGQTYEEAPFTPWPDRDPSMIEAALNLSNARDFRHEVIHDWAGRSFRAEASRRSIVACIGLGSDREPRLLTPKLLRRLAGFKPFNPALMAPLADGAAFVALTTDPPLAHSESSVLEILDYRQAGADPQMPGLSCAALADWLSTCETDFQFHRQQMVVSLMESFVVQVLANIQDLDLNPDLVNPWGGLLSRGHPIGASGAVLVCDLFDNLLPGQIGLAMIPAAGGLASGLLVRRPSESP